MRPPRPVRPTLRGSSEGANGGIEQGNRVGRPLVEMSRSLCRPRRWPPPGRLHAEGWLWLSILKASRWPSPRSTTPGVLPAPPQHGPGGGKTASAGPGVAEQQCFDPPSPRTAQLSRFASRPGPPHDLLVIGLGEPFAPRHSATEKAQEGNHGQGDDRSSVRRRAIRPSRPRDRDRDGVVAARAARGPSD